MIWTYTYMSYRPTSTYFSLKSSKCRPDGQISPSFTCWSTSLKPFAALAPLHSLQPNGLKVITVFCAQPPYTQIATAQVEIWLSVSVTNRTWGWYFLVLHCMILNLANTFCPPQQSPTFLPTIHLSRSPLGTMLSWLIVTTWGHLLPTTISHLSIHSLCP